MERKIVRMLASEKMNSVVNLGTTYVGKCPCCNKVTDGTTENTIKFDGTRQGVVYFHKACLFNHNASENSVGKSESKTRNFVVNTTISADDLTALSYVGTFPYFNVKNWGVMVRVESVKVINNSAMNKILSGLVAFGDNRKITIEFDGGLVIETKVSTANDCIDLINKMDMVYEGGNAWNKHFEKLVAIATIK